tara:strand:- start:605 stop:829 length:225 start_codon:yes stop_codon:yes gene_type:complete
MEWYIVRTRSIKFGERGNFAMTFSKQTLWMNQVANFGFELDANQLLIIALSVGFVKKVGDDSYEVNEAYEGVTE